MESTSHPVGLQQTSSRLSQNRGRAGTVFPGGLYSGGSWPRIFRVTEVSDLTAFCLWFPPTHPLLHPPPKPGYQDSPFNQKTTPTARTETSMEGVWIHGEAGAPPHGVSDLGDLAHGEGATQGRACSSSSGSSPTSCRAQSSVPQEEKKRGPLFRKSFITCDLGKLTITCLSTCKMPYVTGLWSKVTFSKPGGSYSLRL